MKIRQTYYSSDDNFRFREIKWFRLKVAGVILGSIVILLATIVAVNDFYYDVLGMGYNEMITLKRDNLYLQDRISQLLSHSTSLQAQLDDLHRQGNDLRRMVDLPAIDEGTRAAGTGGAVATAEAGFLSRTVSDLLKNAGDLTSRLQGELSVQRQNYQEIYRKYEQNREFFAALPALKPMEGSYSPTGFGMRMHPVLGVLKPHEGLDIINDVGTTVVAAGGGIVEFAGHSGGGLGILVIINHGYGYQTLYAHLSSTLVKEGQRVKRGDRIAKSGKSGLVSGPHLHYEVHYKGVRQNPVDYFMDDVSPGTYLEQVASAVR
jgi:murein DD-endopeptidase MepM/ murein hydrolase activator NlpD